MRCHEHQLARPNTARQEWGSCSRQRCVELSGLGWDAPCPFSEGSLGAALLAPTRLYVKQALAAVRAGGVHAPAHITGGGLTENPPRVVPEGLACEIDLSAWQLPPVFRWLAQTANMAEAELLKTFNARKNA